MADAAAESMGGAVLIAAADDAAAAPGKSQLWAKLRTKHRNDSAKKRRGLHKAGSIAWGKLVDDPNMKAPAAWNDRFQVLLEYKKKYGHCDVPADFSVQWLASWVAQNRTDYDLFVRGDPRTPMTEGQVKQLTEAGFDWEGLAPLHFASGGVAIQFTPNGWEHAGADARGLADAKAKLEKQDAHVRTLVTQLKDARAELKTARDGNSDVARRAVGELQTENATLRDANAKLLEALALARLDEKKSHEAYLRQKLQIRGYKQELLRCYELLRGAGVDPTPSAIVGGGESRLEN